MATIGRPHPGMGGGVSEAEREMNFKTTAILGASWLALASAAGAQTATSADSRDARIQQLEDSLAQIQSQLEDLRESQAANVADVRRVAAEQPVITLAGGRPTIATPDGQFKFALRGLFQFDAAYYLQDDDRAAGPGAAGSGNDLSSGANFRRARIGFEGTVFRDWNYALTYEAGGSGVEASGLQQAYLEYAGWKPFGLTAPVRFRAGAFAVENTLEGATSNTDQIFLERPAVADLVRSTFGGDGRNAFGIYANGDRLNLSLIATGGTIANADVTPAAAGTVNDEGTGYVARVAALALRGPESSLHIGANYSAISQLGDSNTGANQIRLRERPELRVDASDANGSATRLVDTAAFTAESARAYGVEVAGQFRNFFLASEWLNIEAERPGALRDPSFSGYYVQGAWTITGERRTWNAVNGGYGGIRPSNVFSPSEDHWGAWEIAARYSVLDLNDNEGSAGSTTPTGGFRGGEQTISTLGLNWYPNQTVRFLLDFQNVEVERLNGAGAQIGQDYQAIALRSQVAF
jgi:phosphate-selective porin OprO/OprP